MLKPTRYGISITSFRNITLGAVHHYGRLWTDDDNGNEVKTTDVLRALTQEDAELMNELDDLATYRAGDYTHRWDYWRPLFAAAVVQAREQFGTVLLEVGRSACEDNLTVNLANDPLDKTEVELAEQEIRVETEHQEGKLALIVTMD